MTGLSLMPAPMLLAALSMALPMPACHASRSITTLLCGGAEPVTITIPLGNGSAPQPGFEFAKACHACRHEDDGPDLA